MSYDALPPLLAAAFGVAAAMPVLLIMLRWGPGSVRRPAPRFAVTIAIAWLVWAGMAINLGASSSPLPVIDVAAGAMTLIGATLVLFVAWSLASWGFSINLLLTLGALGKPVDLYGWADHYTGGRSIEQICLDRLQIILALRLARRDGEMICLVPGYGHFLAALLGVARSTIGLHDDQ